MTSADIRQSFLDFFRDRGHTIVPSASLLPQSPGLLFTNAGMNPFVPYFLGTQKSPYDPPRVANTQKCIRAGGKHNDLEDVGLDTYHHTLFEMLGNWSFGDYFKAEAIQWAWDYLTGTLGLPPQRLYATVYAPDKAKGDPAEFDQEAWDHWAACFRSAGLDPAKHIVDGGVDDNFWMMGDTGPCGPCSEVHMDLTPAGDTGGRLVNADSDCCIEIWNLVFIQFNAEADGSFRPLPARHVDTGMGFERLCSILQNTDGLRDFSSRVSNYNTDVFRPLFATLEGLSGKTYRDVYPADSASGGAGEDEVADAIAFRVLGDHIRTLSLAIADGILPGNTGRNYVLRRILRRAVRYGRRLGFSREQRVLPPLVAPLVDTLGGVFPELVQRRDVIVETLQREEDSFNETLDRGLRLFDHASAQLSGRGAAFPPAKAFQLYDTYGFPLDLTRLLCQERGFSLDEAAVEALMEQQRERSRAGAAGEVVRAVDISTDAVTAFTGFDQDETDAVVLECHQQGDWTAVIPDKTPFYAEMGGQVADSGVLVTSDGAELEVGAVQQVGGARVHLVESAAALDAGLRPGESVRLVLAKGRRRAIEAHHTATHLLHWALHQHVSAEATQQGSLVAPDRLRFDFTGSALGRDQIRRVEQAVNETIAADAPVSWTEVPHAEVRDRSDVMQFFGDKYGDRVRVVQIGGAEGRLDGFSMELCGGTHVRRLGPIGAFLVRSEGAIAAGVRRIEAVTGEAAEEWVRERLAQLEEEQTEAREKLDAANSQLVTLGVAPQQVALDDGAGLTLVTADGEGLRERLDAAEARLAALKEAAVAAGKALKKARAGNAAREAADHLRQWLDDGAHGDAPGTGPLVRSVEGVADLLQDLLNGLKQRGFDGAALLVVDDGERLHIGCWCGPGAQARGLAAGKALQSLAPIAGGKGGGRPDQARGAAPRREQLPALLDAAREALL